MFLVLLVLGVQLECNWRVVICGEKCTTSTELVHTDQGNVVCDAVPGLGLQVSSHQRPVVADLGCAQYSQSLQQADNHKPDKTRVRPVHRPSPAAER